MDWLGIANSAHESTHGGADKRYGKGPAADQRIPDESGYGGSLVPPTASDYASSCESRPADDDFLANEGRAGEFLSAIIEQTTLACLGSGAGEEDREHDDGQTTGRKVHGEEARALVLSTSGSQQPAGRGGGSDLEEEEELLQQPPSTAFCCTYPLADENAAADGRNAARMPESRASDQNSGARSGEGGRDNLEELAERLSDRLGMSVATVFYEVLEQSKDPSKCAARVDDLSKLLGAALKESLVRVLTGEERAIFLENFKNSFISTYKTIWSVRRTYLTTGGKLPPSLQQPSPSLWRESGSKPSRVSPSRAHRDVARTHFEDGYIADSGKSLSVGDRRVTKKSSSAKNDTGKKRNAGARASNYQVHSIPDDETTSFASTKNWQRDEQSDTACSSGKSSLHESLQLSFFTSSNYENYGQSDHAQSDATGSCSKNVSEESLESSLFTSTNLEQGGYSGQGRSAMDSPLSQPTPDARDVKAEHLDSEDDSEDCDMFSAANSSENEEWQMIDRDEGTSSVVDQRQRSPSVSSDTGALRQRGNCAARFAKNKDHLPIIGSGSDSMPNTGTIGSFGKHTTGPRQQAHLRRPSRNPLGGVIVNSSGEQIDASLLAGCSSIMTMTSGSRESAIRNSEYSTDVQAARRRGVDHLGRNYGQQEGGERSMAIHRQQRPVRVDVNPREGSSIEDDILSGISPFLDHGGTFDRQALLQRSVEAQETHNYLKSLELAQSMKRYMTKEDHLLLQRESNILMRENVDLSRSRAEFKELELEDRKLTLAYQELSRMCADELVAGLCVMLLALTYGAWKFSYARLSRIVTTCQLPVRESRASGWFGTNWMHTGLNTFTGQVQALTCEVTKAGRMLAGIIFIAFVASSLFRRSVTSSSQAMPASIILVLLAGVCGFAGKISIDSLGGRGFRWLIFWESLCFLHMFATCCTPWLHRYLYGPSRMLYRARASYMLMFCSICARFFFHTLLVVTLPVMAGLLPFASPQELNEVFWEFWG